MGPFGSSIKADNFVSSGVPVIRGANLNGTRLRETGYVYLTNEKADELRNAEARPGDIVITHRGTLGQVVLIPRNSMYPRYIVSQSQLKLSLDETQALPEFVVYWLQSSVGQHALLSFAAQTGVPALAQPLTSVRQLDIPLPPIEEQRSTAATLGALDDKIESNRRATCLLGNLAQACFAVWRERAVPIRAETFGSFAEVFGGATPRTTEPTYWDGGLAWTTPTDVTRLASPYLFSTSRTISDAGLRSCTAVMHPTGTIFMTSRATIGAFAVNQIPASTNQGFIAVRPRRSSDRWFLFEEMRSRIQEFLDNANGSTFLEISRGRFKELSLGVPTTDAINELYSLLAPLHAKAAQLAKESTALERLRKTLLPELLSGRIRVSEAEEGIG